MRNGIKIRDGNARLSRIGKTQFTRQHRPHGNRICNVHLTFVQRKEIFVYADSGNAVGSQGIR